MTRKDTAMTSNQPGPSPEDTARAWSRLLDQSDAKSHAVKAIEQRLSDPASWQDHRPTPFDR